MFRVNLMLADAASVAEGKLNMLGGGWSVIMAGGPFAVCGKIDIPWHQGTDWHQLRLELVDGDGQPVLVAQESDGEGQPVAIDLPPYRSTIAPHVKPGTSLDWPFAVTIGPGMPLEPSSIYEWRASINGHADESWTLPFTTAPAQALQQAA